MDLNNVKIAIATDDGQNVSSHFGRAPYYSVLTVENRVVVAREQRPKFAPHGGQHAEHGAEHHEAHQHRHSAMVEPIRDCKIVVARGMGDGAYIHLTEAGMETVLTSVHTVKEVEEAVREGTLQHQPERVHHHGGTSQ